VLAVLQLAGAGKLRASEKTQQPTAATVVAVTQVLAGGEFYPAEPIAAFAWPLLLQVGGLAELAGGRLQLTAKGRAAPGTSPAQRPANLATRGPYGSGYSARSRDTLEDRWPPAAARHAPAHRR
jgi:hypothetical protein